MARNCPGLALTALVLVCAGACASETATTLDALASYEDLRVQPSLERDVCSCPCDNLVCWDLSCTRSGCSRADVYELSVRRPEGECLESTRGLSAQLVAGGERHEPRSIRDVCGQLEIEWRGDRAAIDPARAHRLEISDETSTWTIDRPFAPRSAFIVEPEALASAVEGEPPVLPAGAPIIVGWSGGVTLAAAHATLAAPARTGPASVTELAITELGGDRMQIDLPEQSATGQHELRVTAATVLASDACIGPPVCHGLALHGAWSLRVE